MKTKIALLAAGLAAAAHLAAAPLTATTAVHVRPNEAAAVVSYLKAGSEPVAAAVVDFANMPAGWMAVELTGPFEAYVRNGDLEKSLNVRPGAPFHQQPDPESAVLTTMERGDKAEITGLRGKWTRMSLDKKIVGYIRLADPPANPAIAPAQEPFAPAPLAPAAYGSAGSASQPATAVQPGESGASDLPRLFQGKFASSKRLFAPRRPYDYQLNDDDGIRYAYLDLSNLLLTDSIEKYTNHVVVVYGTMKTVPNTKEVVIVVESLQLR